MKHKTDFLDDWDGEVEAAAIHDNHSKHYDDSAEPPPSLAGRKSRLLEPGSKVNHLTVLGPTRNGKGKAPGVTQYLMKCDCGTEVWFGYHAIYNGSAWSCGCLERHKHPNIRLEQVMIGTVEVGQWLEDEGAWEMVCMECGCQMKARNKSGVGKIGREGCDEHRRREAALRASPAVQY